MNKPAPPPTPSPQGEGGRPATASSYLGGLKLYGGLSTTGLVIAIAVFAIDQMHKWWMLGPFDIAARQPVTVAPFLDLVLAWNRGISYGWLAQESEAGRWALIGLSLVVVLVLWLWLAQAGRTIAAVALGLMIGGALGNTVDRLVHGAVADFFLFHGFGFSWYVFNIADSAIVAGVILLLYESLSEPKQG